MKILFLHCNQPDYLGESLFHGLRSLLGKNCVDVPRYDSLYAPLTNRLKSKVRGNGFTLYGLLPEISDLAEERFFWRQDINSYDLIVIAHIWYQWELFWELSSVVDSKKLVLLDGHDISAFFPFMSFGWRLRKCPWTLLSPISRFKYFKRELIGEGYPYGLERFLPKPLRQWIPLPKNAIPISFSIPEEKIWKGDANKKTKNFTTHIVDREVAESIPKAFCSPMGSDSYAFLTEEEYYQDLRQSRFGITTKRAGWDALRHYELAANGCVLCFRDLDLKPATCAPHGLNESKCIIYHNYAELEKRISSMTIDEYLRLQEMTYKWIELNTTIVRAKWFIEACNAY